MCSCDLVHWICTDVSPRDTCSTFAGTATGYGVGVVEIDVIPEAVVVGTTSGIPKWYDQNVQ